MKAPIEDFLIPFDVALARVCPAGQLEDLYVGKAVELRLRLAVKAQQEHHEKLQQLADQWMKEQLKEIEKAVEHSGKEVASRATMIKGADFLGSNEYQRTAHMNAAALRRSLWAKVRGSAPEIFRDLIPEEAPRKPREDTFTAS